MIETGMNPDRDEVRSLQRHYMRPGRKSRVITWDRHEMRRQLKVFHIQSTFSMLHIGRWPSRYEPNHRRCSSTAGDVFRNVSFCNGMCYTFKCFSCFPSAILRALQSFAHARPLTQCSVAKILRPVWKCLRLHVVPVQSWPGLRFSFRSIYRNESSRSELSFCTGLM